jgi:hypothetical protein
MDRIWGGDVCAMVGGDEYKGVCSFARVWR